MKINIQKANEYIANHRHKVVNQYRGKLHLLPPIGWMNDPNGFVYFKGEYHLFYQFHPYDSIWGPMHWGHAKSRDLVHWEELPVVLAPSETYDQNGCFSGSALVVDDRLVLIYTGHVEAGEERIETQCIATSKDGIVFDKYVGNPVISQEQIQRIADIADFRDPKMFKYGNIYYTVVASKTADSRGQILLFESTDGFNWQFKSVLLEGNQEEGIMWECPDLFELDGKWVLMISPIEMKRQQYQYWNINSTLVFIGEIDWKIGRFKVEHQHEVDGGLDFYAPQTCVNDTGERYLVAWMQMWNRTIPSHELGHGWSGMMTLPRKLSIKNNCLYQEIPRSLFQQLDVQGKIILSDKEAVLRLENSVRQQQYIRLELEQLGDFELQYAKNEHNQFIKIAYSQKNQILEFSRVGVGYAIKGKEEPYSDTRYMRLTSLDEPFILELARDTNSLELFINGQTMSMTFYEKKFAHDLVLKRENNFIKGCLELYNIS
ncbi:glycoside hydrolase family 32 protein [Streptococcus intermedius]|uniref:glycoside hydrolase family 32 protein n=1 Tax=Streptococcus intermedius TaxID=1338 RepID=UPI00025B7461|nr:glycoside hydrolase family 32 protein [Streptococcus intermedius]EID83214.1 sucrose-6-phosphate hydrolase [Streptococcus intermedius SK54 = ATCC 27335]EPH04150.1 beta-fructofuranosidase [Streptococcus intermedius SK54 = ATCC 27335]PMR66485.1 sucrose-6-phosphate hydrolase [Streptococcus intermedius]PMR93449.1 sucrose-6-phosphate hydrolase [Streptococcus intermedius]SQH52308.1 beta-fructofuranosidase [Streptococcus intermedius]